MPAPKTPLTFDQHLGAIISDAARRKGGRPFIAKILGVSKPTIDRRSLGQGGYTVKDLHLLAPLFGATAQQWIDQALAEYGGSVEAGLAKLLVEANVQLADEPDGLEENAVSEAPVSFEAHKKKKSAKTTDYENDMKRAGISDDELMQDEPDPT